jgi:Fe-S cluster biogenesis protein NfuA
MAHIVLDSTALWMIIASGNLAIFRMPVPDPRAIPEVCRRATATELLAANQGYPFPWGRLPQNLNPSRLWAKHRIGIGGLIHDRWFVTRDGRFGGAPNVPETLPGSLRCSMFLDGGKQGNSPLEENEGYAIVHETLEEEQQMYRKVQLFAAEHVVADGGAVIVSPVSRNRTVYVGFVGRCMQCPNAELVSFRQMRAAFPEYNFELFPEWQDWQV